MSAGLGDQIRELRKAKGYTLEELAEKSEFQQELYLGAGEQGSSTPVGGEISTHRHCSRGHDRLPSRRRGPRTPHSRG